MEMFTLIISTLCLALAAFYIYTSTRKRKNYPPGPTAYPIVGNLLQISADVPISFKLTEYAQTYGPIYSLQFGKYPVIVLNEANIIREAFNNPIFNGRPNNKVFRSISGGNYGILAIDGQNWAEQRRFTLRHLRDFGFGKNQMETLILDEAKILIDNFKEEEGNPIELSRRFNLAILNSLWIIMTGSRIDHNDVKLNRILDDLFKQLGEVFCEGVISFIPELTTLCPERCGWNSLTHAVEDATSYFKSLIAEHEKTLSEDDPRDFIDSYLMEVKNAKDADSNFFGDDGIKNLVAIIFDLFAAGGETTSATMNWAVFYMANYPDVQKQVQTEIDQIIGQDRLPSLADRSKMTYTEAVMLEILRKSSIADLGLFHVTLEDIKFHGYEIPKGTFVLPNFYWVHHDPKNWENPEEFNPDRFLNSEKTSIVKSDNLMPFSIGRRVCIGEALARDEFFLFFTSIFQRFSIEFDPSRPKPSTQPLNTFILKPKKYFVIMHDRVGSKDN